MIGRRQWHQALLQLYPAMMYSVYTKTWRTIATCSTLPARAASGTKPPLLAALLSMPWLTAAAACAGWLRPSGRPGQPHVPALARARKPGLPPPPPRRTPNAVAPPPHAHHPPGSRYGIAVKGRSERCPRLEGRVGWHRRCAHAPAARLPAAHPRSCRPPPTAATAPLLAVHRSQWWLSG
eukprot:COSAG01_NODE_2885_length_6901_cov_101.837028_3_plen_180_part_00